MQINRDTVSVFQAISFIPRAKQGSFCNVQGRHFPSNKYWLGSGHQLGKEEKTKMGKGERRAEEKKKTGKEEKRNIGKGRLVPTAYMFGGA